MNDNQQVESEIDRQIGMLDQFAQPAVSDELMANITRSMSKTYRQKQITRVFFRIGTAMAAAAVLVLAFFIFQAKSTVHQPQNTPRQVASNQNHGVDSSTTEPVAIWSLNTEEVAKFVFADLDFSTPATQPTAKSTTTDETIDALNQAVYEVMNLS